MSEEEITAALNELKECVKDMIKVSKRLVRVTKKGIDLTDYRTAQDTYLKLDQLKSVVQAKLLDWEDLLPEDGEGDVVYPDIGMDGFEFTPVKSKIMFKTATNVLESAELAIAKFVVSLNPRQHIEVNRDAKMRVMGDRNHAEILLAPHVDEDSESEVFRILVPR